MNELDLINRYWVPVECPEPTMKILSTMEDEVNYMCHKNLKTFALI